MCRMYGFRANEPTKVDCSLVHAQNALMLQSRRDRQGRMHPHGWGLACYTNGQPSVVKKSTAAYEDLHFSTTVEQIFARTVLAHIRYATVGTPSLSNSHPFEYGIWTFAHNGTVTAFTALEPELRDETAPDLLRHRLGETDSELVFLWLLTRLSVVGVDWYDRGGDPRLVARVVAESVRELASRCERAGTAEPARLNFLLTDGCLMVATRWNNSLYVLQRDGIWDCELCGIPHIQHDGNTPYRALVIASEPVTSEPWQAVRPGCTLVIDSDIQLLEWDSALSRLRLLPATDR